MMQDCHRRINECCSALAIDDNFTARITAWRHKITFYRQMLIYVVHSGILHWDSECLDGFACSYSCLRGSITHVVFFVVILASVSPKWFNQTFPAFTSQISIYSHKKKSAGLTDVLSLSERWADSAHGFIGAQQDLNEGCGRACS